MNNKVILGIVGLIIVAGIILVATKSAVYCSSDGVLMDTMPMQSHRSYCIKSDSAGRTYSVNAPNEYWFSIIDDQGNTLKNFEITHAKLMHVIVVRKDLAYFQHVHPEFEQTTGRFALQNLKFPADGEYRIFADFAPAGGQKNPMGMPLAVTISDDVSAGNLANYKPQAVGSEEKTKKFDGYQVTISSDQALVSGKEVMLTFDLKQNGKPVTDLEEYLGALGHSVVLREGNLDLIHAHPMEDAKRPQTGEIGFMVDFPEAGKYKVFTQFQRGGKVFTTDFVVRVIGNSNMNMPSNMDHS